MRKTAAILLLTGLFLVASSAMQSAGAAKKAPKKVPDLQVQLQVWITQTTEQGLRDLGGNLRFTRQVRGKPNGGGQILQQFDITPFENGRFPVTVPAPDTNPAWSHPTLRPNPRNSEGGVGITYTLIDNHYGSIDGFFRAIEQKADGEIISKPELLVINGQKARIEAQTQVPYQKVTYNSKNATLQLSLDRKPVGAIVEVVPTIQSDGMVSMNFSQIKISQFEVSRSIRGIDMPIVSDRIQKGTVLVPNGDMLVIGGLSTREVRQNQNKVPLVGDIPLLGMPFRWRGSSAETIHLLMWVAPTVIDLIHLDDKARSALHFWHREGYKYSDKIDQEMKLLKENL